MSPAAYAPVSVLDEPLESVDGVAATARLQENAHPVELRCPPPTFQHIAEARHLTWTDSYYDGKHGVIAAFDRDLERSGNAFAVRYVVCASMFVLSSVMYFSMIPYDSQFSPGQSVVDGYLGLYMFGVACLSFVMAWRGREAMMNLHVAVTTEGIRFDNGVTITIPFETIQQVEVASHKFCCRTDPLLSVVTVHRDPAPMEKFCCRTTNKTEFHGIRLAQEFADLVMALKDAQVQGTYDGSAATMSVAKGMELPEMSAKIAHMESV